MPKQAAVSYIEREDGRLLVVWNKRYGGWSLPGGMAEPEETNEQAQERELAEETSLNTLSRDLIYQGPHGIQTDPSRASHVMLYRVKYEGTPREMELGCPVTWLTRDEFLKWSPFAPFYAQVFDAIPPAAWAPLAHE
jgi:ADP-ribose pyrophosphatase YjhB (NUDIX family)